MKTLLLLTLSMPMIASGQGLGISGFIHPIDDGLFKSCDQVKNRALELASGISRSVYFMQLYPKGGKSPYSLFGSDQGTAVKFSWLSQNDPRHHPYALFYFVQGAYTFRCRDEKDRYTEFAATPPLSSEGHEYDPLYIQLSTGPATIWHFWATNTNMDTVYVVTKTPLEKLNQEEVLSKVTERLGARTMFLFVRNDPWFFGYVEDSIPFIFTDSYPRITEAEYETTHTMVCYTNSGCKVGHSLYDPPWKGPVQR